MNGKGLALFFTRGVTLELWHRMGHLSRELPYYRRLGEALGGLTFVTYGGDGDAEIAKTIPDVRVLHNRWGMPPREFARKVTELYADELQNATIFKSNQLSGAEAVISAGRKFGRPAIVRCGWIPSAFKRLKGGRPLRSRIRDWLSEFRIFRAADAIIVTTDFYRDYVARRYLIHKRKIAVIPNFIDTDTFKPMEKKTRPRPMICFVGRFAEQKNLPALIEAVSNMNVSLKLIGSGPMRGQIEELAKRLSVSVEMPGNMPNSELPACLAECTLFAFPSLYEGHPKALLEAMSCGLPVVVTPVTGIREMVTHGQNAYICRDTSPEAIREGIETLLADAELRERLGRHAREFVVRNFALEQILEKELVLYREMGVI